MASEIDVEGVWNQYRAQIEAFLHSKISNSDEIDDLLQEIFIKIYKNLSSLKSERSVKAWLFQIANHAIIDFYRKRSKIKTISTEDLWFEQRNHQLQQELSQCVEPFINALPKETADLLTEIELNGRTQKEYANALGVSYSTIKSRVQKGRKLLKSLFEECCHFSLDKNGSVIDFDQKSKHCKYC